MRKLQKPSADRLTASLLGLIYPSRCPACDGNSDSFRTAPLCGECFSSIKRYTGPACRVCAMPFDSVHTTTCGQCLSDAPRFRRAVSFGLYEGALRDAINEFKFTPLRRLWRPLGSLVSTIKLPRATGGIVPVPMRVKGLRRRGFNQSALLARSLSRAHGLPLSPDLLIKVKDTPPQLGLTASQRRLNLRGAFSTGGARLGGESIVLVDDIMTTGATARECARALKKGGAGEITVVTLARTRQF